MYYLIAHVLLVANQSVSFVSVVSSESANTKFTLTHAEEQFKIITRLPYQPVQCSSATATANQPYPVRHSARVIIPQMQTSHQQNQSVQSKDVTQNLHHPPETVQSITDQQPSLVVTQEADSKNMSVESHSEVMVHQQDETEMAQDQHTSE